MHVLYVTRPYWTRHGEGPFVENQEQDMNWVRIKDETNTPNQFQGSMRTGLLDVHTLAGAVQTDMARSRSFVGNGNRFGLALTCLDQVQETEVPVTLGRKTQAPFETSNLAALLHSETELPVEVKSFGPTAEDVMFTFV
jgi:hypothetical protein